MHRPVRALRPPLERRSGGAIIYWRGALTLISSTEVAMQRVSLLLMENYTLSTIRSIIIPICYTDVMSSLPETSTSVSIHERVTLFPELPPSRRTLRVSRCAGHRQYTWAAARRYAFITRKSTTKSSGKKLVAHVCDRSWRARALRETERKRQTKTRGTSYPFLVFAKQPLNKAT